MTILPPKEKTVLVVDDNPGDRRLISMALKESGCHVLEAEGGEAALEIFRQNSSVIDMVLTDIIMPRMDGVQLVERIRGIAPRIKVIFISSYKRRLDDGIDGRPIHFVEKSSDFSPLVETVWKVFEEPPPLKKWLAKMGFY